MPRSVHLVYLRSLPEIKLFLDEFDVFMDAVNRRISMKMMVNLLQSVYDRVFMCITPRSILPMPQTGNSTFSSLHRI